MATVFDAPELAVRLARLPIHPADLTPDYLIPDSLDYRVSPRVAAAVAASALAAGLAQRPRDPREVEAACRDRVYEGAVVL